MATRTRRRSGGFDYWPGFVDALSTMLLTVIFLLSVFVLGQYFLAREVSGRDSALQRLNRQIEELTSLLALERAGIGDSKSSLASLMSTLEATQKERDRLQGLVSSNASNADAAGGAASAARQALDAEKQVSARALAQVDILNQQISALRRQLAPPRKYRSPNRKESRH